MNSVRRDKTALTLTTACVGLSLAAAAAQASTLMLDFGPTTPGAADNTLSMGHFAGAIPATETTWNIVTGDTSSLLYSDGSTATGVSADLGRSDFGGSNVVNFSNNSLTSSALGGQETWGIYTNTSPVRDGVFAPGTSSANTNALGVRINGLAAGSYTLYISGRNTSTAVSAAQRFFCGSGPSASTFSFSTAANSWVDQANSGTAPGAGTPTQADAITSTFAYGDNCAHLTVTLGAGDSLYLAVIGTTTDSRGFLNALQIVPGNPVLTNFPPIIGKQPAGATVYEGSSVTLTNVKYAGLPPLTFQWRLNGTNIDAATGPSLTLPNVAAAMAGSYSVAVNNSVGLTVSSNAILNVIPIFNTGQMSNLWNLVPGDRFYITATNTTSGERGLAFNPATSNLLVVCQIPSNNLVVLDAATGAEKRFMNLNSVPAGAAGINMVGVAADGVVYAANVTANAGSPSTPYMLWRWDNDSAEAWPSQLLSGDPGYGTAAAGLRWGDNIAVRGSGADTQILIAPGSGTNVCLFTTPDGYSFYPQILSISDVPSGFAQFGIAFGPQPNTFWAKALKQPLYLVQYDTVAATGAVLRAYSPSNGVPDTFRFVSTDSSQKWLAGIMSAGTGLPDNVRLYNISNLTNGPALADQELYTTTNRNNFLNGAGTGSTAFGGDYLFALDSQNGIKAFLINTNYSPLAPFKITRMVPQGGSTLLVTWESVSGSVYQVQSKDTLADSTWANVGSAVTAAGATTSVSVPMPVQKRFFRVQGQ